MNGILKITPKDAREIIDKREPHGLFYLEEDGVFVGIDNSTGDAWIEEFPDMTECLLWLYEHRKLDWYEEEIKQMNVKENY